MKRLLFIFFLFSYLFISQDVVLAQKKSKKIERWDIFILAKYFEWYYCENDGYIDDKCIEKMRIAFQNFGNYHVSSITFLLTITNSDGITLYKKKHTVPIDLDPDETAFCKEFYLKEKVWDYKYGFSDPEIAVSFFNVEILSAMQ